MLKKNLFKKSTTVGMTMLLSLVFASGMRASASEISYEEKIEHIKNTYESVSFEDGVLLKVGERLNIEEHLRSNINILSKADSIFDLNENEIIAKKVGTSFVIYEANGVVNAMEVSVSAFDYGNNTKATEVNRSRYKVFVDPGHGGSDPGAVGNGLRETDLNLQISHKIKKKLEEKNVEVVMSRTGDSTVSLLDRSEMANRVDPDAFISVHQNSFHLERAYGIETYYHPNKQAYEPFASSIQSNLIKETGAYNRGVKTANFSVIRNTNMTSALIECGFISNPSEASKLSQEGYQEKVATAITNGVYSHLKKTITLQPEKGIYSDTTQHWAKNEIKQFTINGYIQGYEDGTFKPEREITRAEFIKIVNKYFGFKAKASGENFADVSGTNWWYSEVLIALKAGYIESKNNYFRPNDPITREEVAAIVTSIKNKKDTNLDKLMGYKDRHHVSQWAKSSVEGAIEAEYMGRESNMFNPKSNITRAEATVTLARIK